MKSTFRSTAAAAAVLLASFGTVMVATPAAAQTRAIVAVAPVRAHIERFDLQGPVQRSGVARYTLYATPGGEAWVNVPGEKRERLRETRPGIYEASYVLHGRDDPALFNRAVATFELRGAHLSARADVADQHAARDVNPPRISDVTPAQGQRVGERGVTHIAARIDDRGAGVQSVLLRVDGRDVSDRVHVQNDQVRYAEDLPAGRHNAELVVRDRAGNSARHSWSFDVADSGRHYNR